MMGDLSKIVSDFEILLLWTKGIIPATFQIDMSYNPFINLPDVLNYFYYVFEKT